MNPTATPEKASLFAAGSERYEALLREATSIRGVSLWQDAWKRLKRSPAAMFSLYFLFLLGLAALLTPLLPLQSPIMQDLRNRQLLAPSLERYRLKISEHRSKVAELQTALASATGTEREALQQQLGRLAADDPVNYMAYDPGPLTKAMIRLRVAMFGDYALPSLAGTDNLGRDLLARIFWGARVSLLVALVAAFVSLAIGVTYGAVAGYVGGTVDSIMMRIVDVLYSVPFIFVVIFAISLLSQDDVKGQLRDYGVNRTVILYVMIGAIYWLTMARVVRGQVLSLKNEQYIDAARTIGASRARIIFRHLIPNVLGVVIVYLTLTIPSVMLFEAFLSFLGLGVDPPDVSWGILVNDGVLVLTPIKSYWWLVLFPGLAFSLTLFALNFLGDGVRDALDPRLKNK